MTEYRAHHEHTSCPLCEPGPLAGFCRHWKVERKVGPGTSWRWSGSHAADPRQAHFVTILAYRPSSKGGQRTIEDHSTGRRPYQRQAP